MLKSRFGGKWRQNTWDLQVELHSKHGVEHRRVQRLKIIFNWLNLKPLNAIRPFVCGAKVEVYIYGEIELRETSA
jgi:hypothetical protein